MTNKIYSEQKPKEFVRIGNRVAICSNITKVDNLWCADLDIYELDEYLEIQKKNETKLSNQLKNLSVAVMDIYEGDGDNVDDNEEVN